MAEHPPPPLDLSERAWSNDAGLQNSHLPLASSLPPTPWATCRSSPTNVADSHKPTLRTFPEQEELIRVPADMPVPHGRPLQVECRLSAAAKSELRRVTSRGCGADNRHSRKAFLIALDAGLLRAQGAGTGLRASQAARKRLLAEECMCAQRVALDPSKCSDHKVFITPKPRSAKPDQESVVLLQIVVESSIEKTAWISMGKLVEVRVKAANASAEVDEDAGTTRVADDGAVARDGSEAEPLTDESLALGASAKGEEEIVLAAAMDDRAGGEDVEFSAATPLDV
mmetsp:Transcript_34962/g.96670  ORF Transcript_34962/g.96670 Transcript_34962/m.96670 type:complete len:284 (-) Transcript_34962:82-933(-)